MLASNNLGKVTITPFLDLFWNIRHYGTPFRTFFLSEKRRLGPSEKVKIRERFKLYGVDFDFKIPPSNRNPESFRNFFGKIDRDSSESTQFIPEKLQIKKWKRYEWGTFSERYLVSDRPNSYYSVNLTLCEAEFDQKKSSIDQAILGLLTEKILGAYGFSVCENQPSKIDNISIKVRDLNKQDLLQLSVISDLLYDEIFHLIIFQSKPNKFLFFEICGDNQHSGNIAADIFSTLNVSQTKYKYALSSIFPIEDTKQLVKQANVLLRKCMDDASERARVEKEKQKQQDEEMEIELQKMQEIIEKAEKAHV